MQNPISSNNHQHQHQHKVCTQIGKCSTKFFSRQNGHQLCRLEQSPHQLVYNLYNIIALTEVKGYAMIQFSYTLLTIYHQVAIYSLALSTLYS